VKSVESQLRLRRNIPLPFSGSRKKPRKNLWLCFHLLYVGFLLGVFLDPEDVPPKRRLTCNGLYVISQKTKLFITTALRTSYPTYIF
jgi:hypothetical protein